MANNFCSTVEGEGTLATIFGADFIQLWRRRVCKRNEATTKKINKWSRMALLRKTNRLQLNVRKSVKHQKHGGRATPSHGSQPATARQHSVRSQTTYNKLLSAYIRGLFSCWLAGCEVTERLGLQSASLANPYFVILPSSDRFPFNWLLCRCSPTSA